MLGTVAKYGQNIMCLFLNAVLFPRAFVLTLRQIILT